MTDPLQSYDVELLKRYDAELQELESLSPAAIELPPLQALAVVTHLQIVAANPAVKYNPLLPSAIYEVLELGWADPGSGESVPPPIFTSTPRRPKKVKRPPPYFPDDYHHF